MALPHRATDPEMLIVARWPGVAERDEVTEAHIGALVELVRAVRNARADAKLEPHQVRVSVRAAGVNFRDGLNALGIVESPYFGFELAGVDPKDVEVRFENGVLTLKGERKLEKEEKRENYHRVELNYGTFTRSFSLPGTVDAEKIRAESRNGVLTVTLPKKPEAKPRSIQVNVS